MLSASCYIIFCTAKNRLLVRLRRLREPRYLVGAIAGAAYFYFAIFFRLRGSRRTSSRRPPTGRAAALLAPYGGAASFIGAGLLLIAALAWMVPSESALLRFTEAETDLLVTAPVTRRQLLIHRLLRSQVPLFFGAVISALFVPQASGSRFRFGAGMFVILVTGRIYFTGMTMARARLRAPGQAERRAAWAPVALLLSAVAIVGISMLRAQPAVPVVTFTGLVSTVGRAISSGAAAVALWPFTAMVRPLFAGSYEEFFAHLVAALAVLAVAVVWVLRSDEIFQHTTDAGAPPPTGRRQSARVLRARRIGWALGLTGPTETVFLWKNATQTLRATNLFSILPLVIPAIVFTVAGATERMSATGARGPAAGFAMGSLILAALCALLGPQVLRSDLRGDLPHLDVIKSWPVKSSAVIRGELLWPTLSLTLWSWLALICATVFSAAAFPALPLPTRLSVSAAAIVLSPALVAAQLTVHNAAAVLFPAWIATGSQRPRGFDAMGQRLILFAAVILALIVMIGPGVIAGGIIAFGFYRIIGAVSVVPAALVGLAIVAIEIGLATEMLGSAYDRIDLSQVERGE